MYVLSLLFFAFTYHLFRRLTLIRHLQYICLALALTRLSRLAHRTSSDTGTCCPLMFRALLTLLVKATFNDTQALGMYFLPRELIFLLTIIFPQIPPP